MNFIRRHHWNDNAPGRGIWDLDAAGESYEELRLMTASLPASAQATAKVLAAARNLVSVWDAYNAADFDDTSKPVPSIPDAAMRLREAIREEREGKC